MNIDKKPIITTEQEIVSVVKMGGYYKFNWSFPFVHFVKEELYIATKNSISKLS